ncbi:response regulator [Methylocystis heyeri]|uniref:Response regulator n=1 Tax=Methylocystis heyeri TaxID=391905 RepID=A0A6B8KIG4_9HYPH|nr:response regulator [Methylocystis heyeri]QGM47467.1 response regulator [Methylocystis heyeri]
MNIGMGEKRRIVLLVDSDPHARSILRNALEASGFSVGEAANSAEGIRTVSRVKPDAVLFDLMVDQDVDGLSEAARLNDVGNHPPVYIVSTAVDALVGAVGLSELGVSGVFLKPVDVAVVVQTLKTRLAGKD